MTEILKVPIIIFLHFLKSNFVSFFQFEKLNTHRTRMYILAGSREKFLRSIARNVYYRVIFAKTAKV